ncbi:hypothetical protein ACQ86N_48165 [Puia sp. P3]|uniref:hypothetical protein n=1 Tax=Puia sp. P3 TaxID=3423952 RepID=UPI003D663DF9
MDVVFEPILSILLFLLYALGFVAFVVELIRRMMGLEQTFAWKAAEVCLILPEAVGIFSDIGRVNDCCHETAMLSLHHRLSILVISVVSVVAYFYSSRRGRLATPGIEVIVNCCLVVGMALWVVIAFHERTGRSSSFSSCLSWCCSCWSFRRTTPWPSRP